MAMANRGLGVLLKRRTPTLMTPSSTNPTAPSSTNALAARGNAATVPTGGTFSTNRNVAIVQADYLALANDLEQAHALSTDLEVQLSGKTNELARFKAIWEKAQADLAKFAADLDAVRKERHALANEVQRGYAFEHKLTKLQASHDELTERAERLETELIRERAAHLEDRAELEKLRGKSTPDVGSTPGNPRDPALRHVLETIRAQLDRVLGPGSDAAGNPIRPKTAAAARIDIEFTG